MASNENCCTNVQTESHQYGLDDILVKIGQFGKFQIYIFMLMFSLLTFNIIITVGFAFTASPVVYRCRIPECDGSQNIYEKPWTEFSIPKTESGNLQNCQRFKPFNSTKGLNFCSADNYDQESKEDCGGDFIFRDREVTISTDFKIFCSDEWKLSMAGTINNVGQVIGIPLGGYFSDRYGRRTVLAYAGFMSAILGLTRSFSPNYNIFIVLGFLDNVFGSTLYSTVFTLGLEFVGPKVRVPACTVMAMGGGIGSFLLALTAKTFQNWRLIERILYVPALGFIALLWILPESVRWLLSQGEEEKAVEVLRKAARINKRKLSDISIEKLLLANRQSVKGVKTKIKFPIIAAFKCFPWRIITCAICWFTNFFVFFGLNLNSALLKGNKYDSFMYVSLIEIPGIAMPFLTMNRYGRRYSLFGFMFLCGISIAATIFVSSDSVDLQLILYLLGKMSIAASAQIMFFFTSEIFPTNIRNSLLSFCSMFGSLGLMTSPQTTLMASQQVQKIFFIDVPYTLGIAKYYESAPAILFAGSALLSSFLALLLPETKDKILPTTFQDAKDIGQKEISVELETADKLLESKAYRDFNP